MGKIFDARFMLDILPAIAGGVPNTLLIAVVAFAAGSVIGFAGAMGKIYRIPVLRQITAAYVSFIRGTPLIVQILLIYYGIPILIRMVNQRWGTDFDVSRVPAIVFMLAAFSINAGAYLTESIRAAILAVDKGQLEAAYSIGMSTAQAMRRIILPQAVRVGLPVFANFFLGLMKDTSLAFAASVSEIMGQAKIEAGRASRFFEAYIDAALVYWVLCLIVERLMAFLEKRSRRDEKEERHD